MSWATKIAAGFDPAIPGRAIAKTGPGRLTPFQSAYAGGWTTDEPVLPVIDVADLRFGAEINWERPDSGASDVPEDQGPTDQARLVKALIGAAKSAAIPEPRRPWLDELAPVFDLTKLRQRTDTELVLGVSDVPEEQRQDVAVFRPDTDGHLAIFGTGGSGKSVAAAHARGVGRDHPARRSGQRLRARLRGQRAQDARQPAARRLRSCRGMTSERVIRLLRTLRDEMAARSERYSAVNAATITDYRRLASKPEEPRILLLIDGFPAFRTEFEATGATMPWYQVFVELLNEGRQVGIHVVITADRPGSIPTAVSSAIQRRVVLRMADEQSYPMLDVPKDILDSASPAGRAIIDGRETQIAVVGGSASAVDQSRATVALGEAITRTGRAPAEKIGSLPREYAASTLPDTIDGMPVLGLSDLDLGPVGFDPTGVLLLGGPPASGRTNALRWIAASVARAMPTTRYYLGNPRSDVAGPTGWAGVARTLDEVGELARTITAELAKPAPDAPKIVVVIEGIGDFLSTPADAPLTELIKAIKRSNHLLVAESEISAWNSSWPLLAEVKSARTGLLLQPESMEGEMVLRTAFPRAARSDFPVGRGYFVARGKVVRVQLPIA